jgi:hypothetical protein
VERLRRHLLPVALGAVAVGPAAYYGMNALAWGAHLWSEAPLIGMAVDTLEQGAVCGSVIGLGYGVARSRPWQTAVYSGIGMLAWQLSRYVRSAIAVGIEQRYVPLFASAFLLTGLSGAVMGYAIAVLSPRVEAALTRQPAKPAASWRRPGRYRL